MADCYQVASRTHVAHVRFAAQPTMIQVTQMWTGTCRWKPRGQAQKKIALRLPYTAGIITRDQRSKSREHALVTQSLELMLWRNIRRIRDTSPYVSQTLYRLKCNRFHSGTVQRTTCRVQPRLIFKIIRTCCSSFLGVPRSQTTLELHLRHLG